MTDWIRVGRALLGRWPSQVAVWGEEGIAAFVEELQADGLTPEQALAGLRMHRPPEGKDYPPSVAVVTALALSDPGMPTFEEMVLLIFGPGGVLLARGPHVFDRKERELLREDAMLKRAAGMHRKIGAFIRDVGLRWLVELDLNHAEWGPSRRVKLKEAWDRFCESSAGREVASLVTVRRGELGSFDPLSALDASFAPRQLGSGGGA